MFCCFCRTVTICNRSDIIVHFKWSNFATLREELQQKDRFINFFFQLTKHTFLLNRHLIIISLQLLILRKYCCFCSLCISFILIFELSWNIPFFLPFQNRFYMDLEMEENIEKDEFFEECLNDPTLRDQLAIMRRKFKDKSQV